MLLWLLAKVELEFQPLGGESLLGTTVPLLFLLALVGIVFGHRLSQASPFHKKSTSSLSNVLAEPGPVADPSLGDANLVGAFSGNVKRPGLTARERRDAVRRDGNPLAIVLTDPSDEAASLEGTVLDRSRGGLLIAATEPCRVGAVLRVRPKDAPEDVAWVLIQIRHARPRNDHWLFGCAFMRKMDWSELLIFG